MSSAEKFNLIIDNYKFLTNKNIISTYKNIIINQKFNALIKDLEDKDLINEEMKTKIHQEFYKEISYLLT